MKKIINPYAGTSEEIGYNCFACAPSNPYGLKMEFYEDGEEVVSYWMPEKHYQGWLNTLHGGIQATLMDETGVWLVSRKFQTAAMTTNLNIKYKKPVPTDSKLELRARIKEIKRSFIIVEITLLSGEQVCSLAEATYYKFPKEVAEKEFHFLPYEVEE